MPMSNTNWFDVRNYSNNIQATIDAAIAAQQGGVVYIPAGVYTLNNTLVIPSNNPGIYPPGITLLGDGPTVTTININLQLDIMRIARSYTHIEGIGFQGAQAAGAGRGIVLSDPGKELRRVSMKRCNIRATGSYCLYAQGTTSSPNTWSILCDFENCDFSSNVGGGALFYAEAGCTTHRFRGCSFWSFVDHAVKLVGCDCASFIDCGFESGSNSQPYVYAHRSLCGLVEHCFFEDTAASQPPTPNWFVYVDELSHSWSIRNSTFRRRSLAGSDPKALQIGSVNLGPKSVIVENAHMLTGAGAPAATNWILLTGSQTECLLVGGVAQGPDPAAPVQLRVQDLSYLSSFVGGIRRFAVPRLTNAEIAALVSPTTGQIVYNRDSGKFNIYGSTGWKGIALTTP